MIYMIEGCAGDSVVILTKTCPQCGKEDAYDAPGWDVTATRFDGAVRSLCPRCSREHVEDMERMMARAEVEP